MGGKKILDDSAVFTCQNGIGVIFAVDQLSNQPIAKESGKKYLNELTKAKLQSPGQCRCQPNPSGAGFLPCSQAVIPVTSWLQTDSVIKIKGKRALTGDSNTICPLFAGKISLQGVCNTKLSAGTDLHITPITWVGDKADRDSGKTDGRAMGDDEPSSQETRNGEGGEATDTNSVNPSESLKNSSEKDMANSKYAKCRYEDCEERDQCEYFNAKPGVDNDSYKLKRQFEMNRAQENQAYVNEHEQARKENPELGWGFVGHHVIPGNQVFMATEKDTGELRYGHLLMLADMCGYDINNANNCILLPSALSGEGAWGSMEPFIKEAQAFDVMDIMKRQWHLGGHAYKIPKDSLKYYKPTDAQVLSSGTEEYFPNYAAVVSAKLDSVNARYNSVRCWRKQNNPRFRDKLINAMDEVSKEIEGLLMKFAKAPKESYPAFVSKKAVDYAYDAPKTGKIILVYKKEDGIYAAKFRVSRKIKNNYQVVVVQNEQLPELKVTRDNVHAFVRYCENIMYFWMDDEVDLELPWRVNGEFVIQRPIDGSDISKYAWDNATELFTFIDVNESPYRGQIALVRKRWEEVRENADIRS